MALPTHYRLKDRTDVAGAYILVEKWRAVRETPHGYWIEHEWAPTWLSDKELRKRGSLKWVSKTSRKRYAHPDIAGALRSLQRRKECQVGRLRLQLESAELVLAKFDEFKDKSPSELSGLNLGRTDAHDFFNWDD